jgi:hypothetical protein
MMANSQGYAPLTELQIKELAELEAKPTRTPKQAERITELVQKRENSKTVVLSDTCIGYLMEHYALVTKGMVSVTKEMDIMQFQKGKMQEKEGIALLSIVDGVVYEKYEGERIYNDYLSGLPDIFSGEEIMKATKINDLKTSWDYPLFLKKINTQLDPANKVQVQGYMDITGAPEGEVTDVLTNMPETIINDYKRKLFYRMGVVTDEAPEYKIAEREMLKSMIFDSIPRHQRVFKKPVQPMDSFFRQKVYDKVKVCRDWLFDFDVMYQKLNK